MADRRNLLLIHPPFYRLFSDSFSYDRYPLGLGYLAGSVLTATDWHVHVYNADFNPSSVGGSSGITFSFRSGKGYENYLEALRDPSRPIWDEVRATIEKYRPDVVGISCMSPNFASACLVAQVAKQVDPAIRVIVGGPHPTATGSAVFDCPHIDVAVRGEGELTIVGLLQAFQEDKSLHELDGILFRDGGGVTETLRREYISDLGTLVLPHEFAPAILNDFGSYPPQAFNHLFANRGCPFHCSFCGSRLTWSRHVRFRPIPHLIREIKGLRDRGINRLYFCDDTFGVNKVWLSDLCHALITECPGTRWSCQIHSSLVDDDVLSIMKKAGCYKIELGIESGSNAILKRVKKLTTIEEALQSARLIQKYDFELHLYYLIGFPFETMDDIEATYKAIRELKNRASTQISIFTPYPGTDLYEYCMDTGIIDATYDFSLHNHQSLDCFNESIAEEDFYRIARDIEHFVDRSNRTYRMRRMLSKNTLWRVREAGIRNSVNEVTRTLRQK